MTRERKLTRVECAILYLAEAVEDGTWNDVVRTVRNILIPKKKTRVSPIFLQKMEDWILCSMILMEKKLKE